MRSCSSGSLVSAALLACLLACQTTAPEPEYPDAQLARALTTEESGVHSTVLRDFDAVQRSQEEWVWCWAACAEMILRFNGVEASQKEIASRIHGTNEEGTPEVKAATFYEILCALNPDLDAAPFDSLVADLEARLEEDPSLLLGLDFELDYKSAVSAVADQYAPTKQVAVEDLRNGHPAVVGLGDLEVPEMGHAYVLIGAEYIIDEGGGWGSSVREAASGFGSLFGEGGTPESDPLLDQVVDRIDGDRYPATQVTLVDPWTGEVVKLTGAEFSERVDFVISRRQARETLKKWQATATVK